MFRCLWSLEMTTQDKIEVFYDMSKWLRANNETLKASFNENDDYFAWNIADYGGEYHYD